MENVAHTIGERKGTPTGHRNADTDVAVPPNTVAHLFEDLHEGGIRYCVLRSRSPLPYFADRDEIDVLVDRAHEDAFAQIVRRHGFHSVASPRRGPRTLDRDHSHFFIRDQATGNQLTIDAISAPFFDPDGGLSNRYELEGLAEDLLESRRLEGPYFAPSGVAAQVERLLHEMINRSGRRRPRYEPALRALADNPRRSWLKYFPFGRLERLKSLARTECSHPNSATISQIRTELLRAVRPKRPKAMLACAARIGVSFFDSIWWRRLNRRVVAVSVAGPDGVGKTTVSRLVATSMSIPRVRVRTFYFGRPKGAWHMLATRVLKVIFGAGELLYALPLLLRRYQDGAFILRQLTFLSHIRVKTVELALMKATVRLQGPFLGDLILLDRSVLDEVCRIRDPKIYARALAVLRRADIEHVCYLLTDDPEAIYQRKAERTPQELGELMAGNVAVASTVEDFLPTVLVDCRGQDASSVASILMNDLSTRIPDWFE